MKAIRRITKLVKQIPERINFTVNIAHDIKRAIEQVTDKTFCHFESKLPAVV